MNDTLALLERAMNPLDGWTTPERGAEMWELIAEHQPKICVEIGVFGGRSLIAQAMALRATGSGHIYGLDPWRVLDAVEGENATNREWWGKNVDLELIHQGCMRALWGHNLEKWATIIRAASQDVAQLWPSIDWLLIDGNHSSIASCRDVNLYLPRVKPGGIIIFDDTDWPSTQSALALLERDAELFKDAGHYRIYRKKALHCQAHSIK